MATRGVIIFTLKLNENNGEFYPDVEFVTLRNGMDETKKPCQLMER